MTALPHQCSLFVLITPQPTCHHIWRRRTLGDERLNRVRERTMINGDSDVSQTLFKKAIHEEWTSAYRSGLNDVFYELAINTILSYLSIGKKVQFSMRDAAMPPRQFG
jgi:hypothetical protein